MKRNEFVLFFICILLFGFFSCSSDSPFSNRTGLAKFEPQAGKILVFVGQDNASVGGNDRFDNGYSDHVGIPAGITHYIGLGTDSNPNQVDGLDIEATWGAGPMCMKYYVDSPELKNSVMHLSIAMVDHEQEVAEGVHDNEIDQIADFLQEYNMFPFLVRIGYEFDGEWNHYDSTHFKIAFRRIVDKFRERGLTNFSTVLAATSPVVAYEIWENYYPGDEYVDWCGYSYWGGAHLTGSSIQFAIDHGKPQFIAEVTPRGHYFLKKDPESFWADWFYTFFTHIEHHPSIKAISYINCDWDAQPMWDGWGDTRIQAVDYIKTQWLKKMDEDRYLHDPKGVFQAIGFSPNR